MLIYKYDGSLADFFSYTSCFCQPMTDPSSDSTFLTKYGEPLAELILPQ